MDDGGFGIIIELDLFDFSTESGSMIRGSKKNGGCCVLGTYVKKSKRCCSVVAGEMPET